MMRFRKLSLAMLAAWLCVAQFCWAGGQSELAQAIAAPLPVVSSETDLLTALRGVLLTEEPDLTRAGKRVLRGDLTEPERKSLPQMQERLGEAVRSLDCWWQYGLPKEHPCADEKQLVATLSEFEPVLARYEQAMARNQSSASMELGRELMDLNKLLFVRIGRLASRGDHDEALRLWRLNQTALARLRNAGGTVFSSAMVSVSEHHSLDALETLLARTPTLAAAQRRGIAELLGDRAWTRQRLVADLRAQYWLVADLARSQFSGDEEPVVNDVLKRQIAYSVEVLPLLLREESDFQSARVLHRSIECPESAASCRKLNLANRRFAESYFFPLSIEVVGSMRRRDAAAQLLLLRLEWDGVGRSTAALAKRGEEFNRDSPEMPVNWDAHQLTLRFENPAHSVFVVRLPR